jgi:hypothetical protein
MKISRIRILLATIVLFVTTGCVAGGEGTVYRKGSISHH